MNAQWNRRWGWMAPSLVAASLGGVGSAQAQMLEDEAPMEVTPAQATASRFTYLAGGSQVKDTKTGLIWQRCSAGQVWRNGSCRGEALTMTYSKAKAYAKKHSGWRLPEVYELVSLVDYQRTDPLINPKVFPATPSNAFWTQELVNGIAYLSWVVFFNTGHVSYAYTADALPVRLVR